MDVAEGSVREFRNQSLIVVIGNICDPPYFPAKNPKNGGDENGGDVVEN